MGTQHVRETRQRVRVRISWPQGSTRVTSWADGPASSGTLAGVTSEGKCCAVNGLRGGEEVRVAGTGPVLCCD